MKRRLLVAGLGLICVAGCASTPTLATQAGRMMRYGSMPEQPVLNSVDQQFVSAVGMGNAAEILLGGLAQQRASLFDVNAYGRRMVEDHTKAKMDLELLMRGNIQVPQAPDAAHQAAYAKLSALSGRAFDLAFMQQMVADHTQTVGVFRMEISQGQNPSIKEWASATLPTIEDHLRSAQALMKRLGE
ncbi:MAG: DUF4142 domain-containing protein [Bacteroidota bacterium]